MFGQVGETPFDLHFSLFGIPCRVHPGFWVVGAIMGWGLVEAGIEFLLVWILCLFVSILVHELGHALAAYHSGYPVQIVLYHFGGLAIYQPSSGSRFAKRYTTGRAIWISFAGPGAGFVLFGVVFGVKQLLVLSPEVAVQVPLQIWHAIGQLEYINLWWGLVNLLPVLPLDGGNICRELLVWKQGHRGNVTALKVGFVVGALVAIGFLYLYDGLEYPSILFGLLAFSNYQQYNQGRNPW